MKKTTSFTNSRLINGVAFSFTVFFFLAAALGCIYNQEHGRILTDWYRLLITPCPLVTDYLSIGSLSSAFLNAGACSLSCFLFMILLKGESTASTMAGYFLVVAHCFYGLNFLNMWPCFLAPFLYIRKKGLNYKQNLHLCMFATSFGPFVSELLFRYLQEDRFAFGKVHLTVTGVVLTVLFSLLIGFVIPALLPGAKSWHKGYNLYNGGLAFGLFGFFLYNFMYRTVGMKPPYVLSRNNAYYLLHNFSYQAFATFFFLLVFGLCILTGWFLNGRSFRGYRSLLRDTGLGSDFTDLYGMPLCLVNIGCQGLLFLAYLTLIIRFTTGAGFTGPTIGVVLAALTFTAMGQHPKNVWPILAGYQALYLLVMGLCFLSGRDIHWTLSTQSYINGAAFATGLCPITGRYGVRYGILAGFICAAMCTATSGLHGGLVLYNGGFTAGITALLLLPVLEHYVPEAREEMQSHTHALLTFLHIKKK